MKRKNRLLGNGPAAQAGNAIIPFKQRRPEKVPTPSEFFSEYTLAGVRNWNEIHVLGFNNVKYLLARARDNEKSETDMIGRLKRRAEMFQKVLKWCELNPDLTAGDCFEEMSHRFENPQFKPEEIGERPNNWSGDLEPLTLESETRDRGSTTFNICGWCTHASGGSCRYSYNITTSCELLQAYIHPIGEEKITDYTDPECGIHMSRELQFNTPCLLKKMTNQQCQGVLNGINFNIGVHLMKREQTRAVINILLEQRRLTKNEIKPWLVNNRPCEYMNVGDPLVVYIGAWGKDTIVKGNWIKAIGVFGYRHHDGCMSYQAQFPVHTNMSYLEGRGGGAGMGRPEALLATEFAALVSMVQKLGPETSFGDVITSKGIDNPDLAFLRIWFWNILQQKLKGFRSLNFFHDLKNPRFALPPESWTPPNEEIKIKTVKDAEQALHCLDSNLFKTTDEIKSWANMQLQFVHPDRHQKASPEVQAYAARQTRAVIAARELLIERHKEKKS